MRNKEDLSNVHPKWFEKASKRHPSCPNEGRTKERKKERKASKRFPSLSFESVECNCYKEQLPLYTHKESQTKGDKKKKADYHNQHISKLLITKNTQYVFDFYNFL